VSWRREWAVIYWEFSLRAEISSQTEINVVIQGPLIGPENLYT
jgi:hypothetical protein